MKFEFIQNISKNVQISNFMKTYPVGARLFHADGWTYRYTERRTDMTLLTVAFSSFANVPKNYQQRNKKATGEVCRPGCAHMLWENGLRITTQLSSNMFETGYWSKDLPDVRCLSYRRSQKLQNAPTIAHSAWSNIQQSTRRGYCEKGLKRKMRAYLENISLDLEEEKERGIQLGCWK